jgi:hypothetical protein
MMSGYKVTPAVLFGPKTMVKGRRGTICVVEKALKLPRRMVLNTGDCPFFAVGLAFSKILSRPGLLIA